MLLRRYALTMAAASTLALASCGEDAANDNADSAFSSMEQVTEGYIQSVTEAVENGAESVDEATKNAFEDAAEIIENQK